MICSAMHKLSKRAAEMDECLHSMNPRSPAGGPEMDLATMECDFGL